MTDQGMHFIVSGRVQGVFFRGCTQKKALALGLTGWARNLADGTVEVEAYGAEERLLELQAWLNIGPPLAKVLQVQSTTIPWQEHKQFKVID